MAATAAKLSSASTAHAAASAALIRIAQLRDALASLAPHSSDSSSGITLAQAARDLADATLLNLPLPGQGDTSLRMRLLLEIGAHDLALARLIEAHTDAVAILSEAGLPINDDSNTSRAPLYGVWAARHPEAPLNAQPLNESGAWRLNGLLPYCTGATLIDRALIVAAHDKEQLLFTVNLRDLTTELKTQWYCAGMNRVPASTLTFTDFVITRPQAVVEPGFYLQRRGFWCGAIGVAACWLGGAVGLLRKWFLLARKKAPNPHAVAHLGASTAAVDGAVAYLLHAATMIDDPTLSADDLRPLALSVRHVIEQVCTNVMTTLGRALGPGPMIMDQSLATQLADLSIYIRQSHAERDLEALGQQLISDDLASQSARWPWLL